jgi:putative peptidoglycan lipid II flippase
MLVMIPVQANLNLYLVVDRFLASHLSSGTISILNYGDKVVKAFGGITTAALGLVIFSYLAEAAASGDDSRLDSTASFALRLMTLVLLPLQVGAIVLGQPLIRLLFQRGAFGPTETALTTVAMNLQLAGLFATGFSVVLYRVLFALQKFKTALAVSSLIVVLNIGLKAALVGPLGYQAMPLAMSIMAVAEAALVCWLLLDRLPALRSRALWGQIGRIFCAAAGMGLVVFWGKSALISLSPVWNSAVLQVVVCGAAGAAVYGALLRSLRVDGVASFGEALLSALGRRRAATQDVQR